MFKAKDGSTSKLIQLCIGYFVFYVITGLAVKYFLGKPDLGFPGLTDMQYLAYSTLGGTLVCLVWALYRRWYRFPTDNFTTVFGVRMPTEFLYIIPSGVMTAVVIPTTTLMYSLPISVMVAMVIMRGSVIVISRAVDAIQLRQGILTKRVYLEENIAVVFAVSAVGVHAVFARDGGFDFIKSPAAMTILGAYILAYAFRIYIMNFFKNTRGKGAKADNKSFFAIEQIAASITLAMVAGLVVSAPSLFGATLHQVVGFSDAVLNPPALWPWATLSGMAFGVVAFFSVFIFMFKGRTATFAGLVNRLTSLIAGTAATLIFWFAFGGKFPKTQDWISLGLILVAVAFLTRAEKKRTAELAKNRELESAIPATPAVPGLAVASGASSSESRGVRL